MEEIGERRGEEERGREWKERPGTTLYIIEDDNRTTYWCNGVISNNSSNDNSTN